MGGSSPNIKAPKADFGSDITSLLNPLSQQIGNIAQFEGQNRPTFGNLNLGDIQTFFQGGGNQQGIFGLGGGAYQAGVDQQLAAQRQQLFGQRQQVEGIRNLQSELSPEAAMATQQASDAARTAYAASLGVTPEEQRMAQQLAREAAQSSGRLGGTGTIASEILGREDILARKRAEAAQAGQQAFQLGQSFYQQPGLQALYSTPAGMQIGQNYLNYGVQSIGQSTPQLFDVGQALNLGAAQRQNVLSAQQANAQIKASNNAAIMGLIGDVVGGAATLAAKSDINLKQNIKRVGVTDSGLPVYTYQYKSNPSLTLMGVMAQDVQKVKPEAVTTTDDGMLAVYYNLID
jgi:hypothetical protein